MNKRNNTIETSLGVIESLKTLSFVCKELDCQFRIFGSLIPAALKGDFYRKIGDVDCFIDKKFKRVVDGELEKRKHIRSTKKDEDIPPFLFFIGFKTENFIENNTKISLLYVSFRENYIVIPLRFGLSFRVPYNLINKDYKFYGKEFKGLIPEAALFNLSFVKDEDKRKIDFDTLFPFCDLDIIQRIKNTDTLFWFNKRIPLISKILASKIDKFLP